jgi:hypothetical protein
MLRIPHCLDNRVTDGGKVVSLTHPPHFTPQKHFHKTVSLETTFVEVVLGFVFEIYFTISCVLTNEEAFNVLMLTVKWHGIKHVIIIMSAKYYSIQIHQFLSKFELIRILSSGV